MLGYDDLSSQMSSESATCCHGVNTFSYCKKCDAYFHRTSQQDPPQLSAAFPDLAQAAEGLKKLGEAF